MSPYNNDVVEPIESKKRSMDELIFLMFPDDPEEGKKYILAHMECYEGYLNNDLGVTEFLRYLHHRSKKSELEQEIPEP